MSVRRLAEASVQPARFAFDGANAAKAEEWIRKYPQGREQSAVIPLLMLAQEQEGWVTKAAIESVADMLQMPYIRALEVATFYTQFQLKPVGTRAHVQVCGTTPCMLRGSEALMDVCREKIHHDQFHLNADGTLSWEEVECLGACVNAPMVMIFKDAYEDLTPDRLAEIIDAFAAGRGHDVTPGPQVDRVYSAPAGGLTSLKDESAVLKSTRDRQQQADEPAAPVSDSPAPTLAAKPKTDAPETSPALASPSSVKVDPPTEKAASADSPQVDRSAADRAEPLVEGTSKRRAHPRSSEESGALKAPELAAKPRSPARKRSEHGPVAEPVSLEDPARPVAIARPDTVDDLQLISGVGPKIEGILHSLGIYTYAQIAAWTQSERGWVDGYLRFRGRIEREDWVRQASALASGGEVEYIRVFGKKPR